MAGTVNHLQSRRFERRPESDADALGFGSSIV